MRMRRLIVLALMCLSLSGCAGWIERFKKDPVAALQDGVGFIRTAASMASAAFEVWASTNQDMAANVRPQFHQVIGDVNRGLLVAQDGLRLAAQTRSDAPDVSALLRDAQTAMQHLHEFLGNLPGNGPGRAADPLMRDALQATQRASVATMPSSTM